MKIVTWNVNGARAREAQILELVGQERPDVLCLQEIKANPEQLPDTLGPLAGFAAYHSYWHGKGGYSGVSLHLRKELFANPRFSHPDFDEEARVVCARAGNVTFASFYVPNGGKDYAQKIAFLGKMAAWCEMEAPKGLVLAGDLNIARFDVDVHRSQRKADAIGQTEEERALFERIFTAGLVDVGRALAPTDDKMFTWWPYWAGARKRNVGWRIDYVLASEEIAKRAKAGGVLREFGTSDHAPVWVELADR
jgi:exodeoxyribonuclease-3